MSTSGKAEHVLLSFDFCRDVKESRPVDKCLSVLCPFDFVEGKRSVLHIIVN